MMQPQATVTMSGPDLTVMGDADKISGILRNVIDNAVRASGPQGQVHVAQQAQQGWAVIDTFDSGPGVAAADRERSTSSGWCDLIMVGRPTVVARTGPRDRRGYAPPTAEVDVRGPPRFRGALPTHAAAGPREQCALSLLAVSGALSLV